MRGEKREEKWRRNGTGAPEGRLGEGKGSHAQRGKLGNHWEGRGSKGSVASFPLPTWAPRNLRSEERRVGKECRSRWSPYH